MTDKTIRPRCPRCGKVQADWVNEAQFTCRGCHLTFVIGATVFKPLTNTASSAITEIKKT